jgi:hypothetical protein
MKLNMNPIQQKNNNKKGAVKYIFRLLLQRIIGIGLFFAAITKQNQLENFDRIKQIGLAACQAELNEKVEILRSLLNNYNDGRRKNFFCLAVNLLELQDVKNVIKQIATESQLNDSIKEKSAIAVHLFEIMAGQRNIVLKLKTKE